jgi:predicted  nucleic acid-binding Zn-ribbon protein
LEKSRALIDEELAAIQSRRERLEAERAEVAAARVQLATDVPEAILPLYERLMKTKAGLAIVPLHDGKCGGCHMKLIASTVVAVQNGMDMTRCEDCGRILYADE